MPNSIQLRRAIITVLCSVFLLIEILIAMGQIAQAAQPIQLQLSLATTSAITLKWTDSKSIDASGGYTVFRNGARVAQKLQSKSFTDRNLKSATKYSYVVKATSKTGVSLRSSQTLHTTTKPLPDKTPPTTPLNFSGAAQSESEIRLQWGASTDNLKLLGYIIYRNGQRIVLINDLKYTDKSLNADTNYEYTVRAIDTAKNLSPASQVVSVRTAKQTDPEDPSENSYQSDWSQLLIRGNFNNYGTETKMELVADYQWEAVIQTGDVSNPKFKFDVFGDWKLNYGEQNGDFIADTPNAPSIPIADGPGEYKITFDESSFIYSITRTDDENPVDPGTGSIELNVSDYSLQVGQIDYLSAVTTGFEGNPSLVWSSSNSQVLAVSGETIKAIAPGTATVKVSLAQKPDIYDTATVTVSPSNRHPVFSDPDLNYVFDKTALPQITVELTTAEWNKLLINYDKNPKNEIEVMANFTFDKNGTVEQLDDIGIRLRGNTSRRRPEGVKGQLHNAVKPDWHHAHFALKFSKFNKSQRFHGMQDMNTKWFKDDALHVRELYSYDLHSRFDVWTAPFSSYAKLTIKIKESNQTAYFGIYQMVEAINQDFLDKRFPKNSANKADGNLWKGTYPNTGPADLTLSNLDKKIGVEDPDNNIFKTYDLKTNKKTIDTAAKPQLVSFIQGLNSGGANKDWLEKNINVDLFLRSLATGVTVGSWDDYWILANNYYMYFDLDGKMQWIPYDFDNTLGTSSITRDSGKQDVMRWGALNSTRPLVSKILAVPEFRAKYLSYLNEMIDPQKNLFDEQKSLARIQAWHKLIQPHISNDTGEDMVIADIPASWGNASYYRLLSGDEQTNFFKAKAAAIRRAK